MSKRTSWNIITSFSAIKIQYQLENKVRAKCGVILEVHIVFIFSPSKNNVAIKITI
jgi:extradiol dioxygenase family protein